MRSYWPRKTCLLKYIKGLWKPFRSTSVKDSQKLLKSAEKKFDPTLSSFLGNLSWKKLFLFRYEILRLLVNAVIATYEYSRRNGENLLLEIRMQLSKKPKTFFNFLIASLESKLIFEHFESKKWAWCWSISYIIDSERRAYLNA